MVTLVSHVYYTLVALLLEGVYNRMSYARLNPKPALIDSRTCVGRQQVGCVADGHS